MKRVKPPMGKDAFNRTDRRYSALRGTAEMITVACARGGSSVRLTSIWGSMPAGTSSVSRAAAPQIEDPHVAPKNAPAKPRTEGLRTGFLGGKSFREAGGGIGTASGFLLLRRRINPGDKTVAEPSERAVDPANVDKIVANADNHAKPAKLLMRCVRQSRRSAICP